MIGVGLLRGVFLGGIMMWYTMSVWKTVDQYFRDQFQDYLTKEYEENTAMKKDVLLEKERLAARKVLLDKLAKLESTVDGQVEPEYDGHEGPEGDASYSGEYGTQVIDGEGHLGYPDHGDYSVEEVDSGQGPGGTVGGEAVLEDYEVAEGGSPLEEDGGECLVEDCDDHGDQVSTRWRNVFDEDGDVCRFDNEHLGAEGSCSQTGEAGDERDGPDGNK